MIQHAVFPVAGLGTRFLPATKTVPKEMLPVVDRPLISYAVEDAYKAGVRSFVFVTSRSKGALEDYFDDAPEIRHELEAAGKQQLLEVLKNTVPAGCDFSFVRQDRPQGLGHAVRCARHIVRDDAFAVLLPDEFMDLDAQGASATQHLTNAYKRTGSSVIGVVEVPVSETSSYGIVVPGEQAHGTVALLDMVEKPKSNPPSLMAAVGRYVFAPGFMRELNDLPVGAGGEIQLTDAIARRARAYKNALGGLGIRAMKLPNERFDCGSKLGYAQANVAMTLRRNDLGAAFREWLNVAILGR